MADITSIKFLYPPNFVGTFDEGDPTGYRKYVIQCTNESDGTGEDEAIKVKRTDLRTFAGGVPSKLIIERIEYSVTGMTVKVMYNNINDEVVAVLNSGESVIDYTSFGGFCPESDGDGEGGDIIFSTDAETLGDSYNIILTVRGKA